MRTPTRKGVQGGVLILLSTGETTHLEATLDLGIAHLRDSGPGGS
ncbi:MULTISPECIES: hypothetical protein [unclassified Nonomuraea]